MTMTAIAQWLAAFAAFEPPSTRRELRVEVPRNVEVYPPTYGAGVRLTLVQTWVDMFGRSGPRDETVVFESEGDTFDIALVRLEERVAEYQAAPKCPDCGKLFHDRTLDLPSGPKTLRDCGHGLPRSAVR
jgi:hypothetical protein